MPAQPSWLAPQLLKSTISRDLGSQGGRRRINPAKASPSVRALRFGDRASSCGKKRGSGHLGFLGSRVRPVFPNRWFRPSTWGPECGDLPHQIFSPSGGSDASPLSSRVLGFPRERLGILHKNSKVFRSPVPRACPCLRLKHRCFKQLQPQEHRSQGPLGWHSGCTVRKL